MRDATSSHKMLRKDRLVARVIHLEDRLLDYRAIAVLVRGFPVADLSVLDEISADFVAHGLFAVKPPNNCMAAGKDWLKFLFCACFFARSAS